jgi:rubrerythrin
MTIEDPFLDAPFRARDAPPASREPDRDAERLILEMLETHGAREGAALAAYKQVAEETSAGPGVRYLVRLILEDEERHHRVFAEMANELRSFVDELDVEPRVPSMAPRADPALLAETQRLLQFEKDDAKELKALRKAVKHSPASSLHPLLVEMMLHDTAKHIAILEHIRSRLKRR